MTNIVLVGAGGTGISSLWFLLNSLGYKNIIGIDSVPWQISQQLETAWIQMIYEHGAYEVQQSDIVIYSDACPSAPEVITAYALYNAQQRNSRIHVQPPYSYFAFLGEISKYFSTIAVAGTHGKSTTTALLTYMLSQTDNQFALGILGALVPQLNNTNYWLNPNHKEDIASIFDHIFTGKRPKRDESLRKKYRFAIEADEFNRHFLHLDIDDAIILNAELDHSDIYADDSEYMETFFQFLARVKRHIYVLQGEKGIDKIIDHAKTQPHLIDKLSVVAPANISDIHLGHLFGVHNQKNALLVKTLCTQYDLEVDTSFLTFTWLRRRMELLTRNNGGALVYSDYWHHPTELDAVYQAMRAAYPDKNLHLIFQPHQARRILQFRDDFTQTIRKRDSCTIYSLYSARENIPDLLQIFPSSHVPESSTPEQLGTLFGQACESTYTTLFSDITTEIDSYTEQDIVCICSAGNLDFQLRGWIAK